MKPRTDKDWTITVISRTTGRRRTWHTNKPPDTGRLMRDNWYVSTAYNRAICVTADDLNRAWEAATR